MLDHLFDPLTLTLNIPVSRTTYAGSSSSSSSSTLALSSSLAASLSFFFLINSAFHAGILADSSSCALALSAASLSFFFLINSCFQAGTLSDAVSSNLALSATRIPPRFGILLASSRFSLSLSFSSFSSTSLNCFPLMLSQEREQLS